MCMHAPSVAPPVSASVMHMPAAAVHEHPPQDLVACSHSHKQTRRAHPHSQCTVKLTSIETHHTAVSAKRGPRAIPKNRAREKESKNSYVLRTTGGVSAKIATPKIATPRLLSSFPLPVPMPVLSRYCPVLLSVDSLAILGTEVK